MSWELGADELDMASPRHFPVTFALSSKLLAPSSHPVQLKAGGGGGGGLAGGHLRGLQFFLEIVSRGLSGELRANAKGGGDETNG